ncbi:tRNA 2-thiouridine(34) synthase MnmA [bacterium]|nr:tRNA 2-thiouridine(34) synthase MnmA [bacterium]
MKNTAKRVAMMMSGGVDSSVAASLLVDQGYDVVGVTMHLWDYETTGRNPEGKRGCCDISDQHDARVVCDQLGIPHMVLDMRSNFLDSVVRPFEQSYLMGETPNPCILCNSKVKWGSMFGKAAALECDYVATGHYASIEMENDIPVLKRGLDHTKDQSYALWEIPRHVLAQTLLPLGSWRKDEIRREADRLNLRTANKPESQDICFIPDHYQEHLRDTNKEHLERIGQGWIVDESGKKLRTHNGYFGYTIGQRKGLDIKTGDGPFYVTKIDPITNTVVVGRVKALEREGCLVREPNWISYDAPVKPERCTIKIRYNDSGQEAIIYPPENEMVRVKFINPAKAVTPGQSAVWYKGDVVWGGGRISRSIRLFEEEILYA